MTTVAEAHKDDPAEPSPKGSPITLPETLETLATAVREAVNSRGVAQSEALGSAESTDPDFEAAAALPRVLKIIGSVVAPTTLMTALLFYFGLMYAIGFFRYFRVNYSVLNLPLQDYLVLSEDGLMLPLIFVAAIALLALWLYQHETLLTKIRGIWSRVLVSAVALIGLILVGLAMVDAVFHVSVFPTNFWEARGLGLSMGVLLLGYTARLRRVIAAKQRAKQMPRRVPEAVVVAKWAAVFVLVSAGLFWAVGSYAILVGQGHARDIEADLPSSPDVGLYSEKGLGLGGVGAPGVHEVLCQSSDPAYRFRYDGLKLVPQSGNQYVFLPAGWTSANGTAIVIPRSDKIRLEFNPPGQALSVTC